MVVSTTLLSVTIMAEVVSSSDDVEGIGSFVLKVKVSIEVSVISDSVEIVDDSASLVE